MEVFTKFNVISTAVPLREGFKKKKKVENSTKRGDFPLRKKNGLKTLDVALGTF